LALPSFHYSSLLPSCHETSKFLLPHALYPEPRNNGAK
jgi:hypothetical protein